MIPLDLKTLVSKLNETCRTTLEGAAGLCLSRTHYDIELEHWLVKLLEANNTDVERIARHFGLNPSRLQQQLTASLDGFKTGNARTPAFSPRLPELIREAWALASINLDGTKIRSGHLLLALLCNEKLAGIAGDISDEFALISAESLHSKFHQIVAGSEEDKQESLPPAPEAIKAKPGAPTKTPALDQFTIDLTERAKRGEIDPVLGRDFEIRQVVDILTRRRQNNPILVGEAGVGKTAVVEGFALRVAEQDVPPPLKNVAIRTLDLGLLQAGAGVKGEFENRLKSVISEVKASPQPIILFIDEAHTMIGAGGQAGQGDAANLLKPALARGELRTIAATTWAEYKQYFEKDAALSRRFQPVKVEEPTEEQAIRMMRGLVATMEQHHKVRVMEEGVEEAVRLSHRYVTGRQLPDKCVSVLDTACARVAIGQSAIPAPIEDCRRRIDQIEVEISILERESVTGADHEERIKTLHESQSQTESRLAELEKQWDEERQLIEQMLDIRRKLEADAVLQQEQNGKRKDGNGSLTAAEVKKLQNELSQLDEKFKQVQGMTPLMKPYVDGGIVAEVISGWTGIPVGKMLTDEIKSVLDLEELLQARVIGQSHALEAISQRIRTARAGLEDPNKPVGVFLLVGPSGTGKTLTGLSLADLLYGGERNMVTINMSEYQEAHTVSNLKGSPKGYVGYGEGGVLTEAVRRKPYSVVLLDEIEKAHRDVRELFYQVFDKGTLEDSEGRQIDFKNTVILLTSNVASDLIMKLCADEETRPEPEQLEEAIRPELLKVFEPAFLGRLIVAPYYPISDTIMKQIIVLELEKIRRRLEANQRIAFSYDDKVVEAIAARCTEVESGGRNVDHILTRTLLPEISREFLGRRAAEEAVSNVHVSVDNKGGFVYKILDSLD
ncbi:MAG: type VI secretion system ATPase TssH [bacterium]